MQSENSKFCLHTSSFFENGDHTDDAITIFHLTLQDEQKFLHVKLLRIIYFGRNNLGYLTNRLFLSCYDKQKFFFLFVVFAKSTYVVKVCEDVDRSKDTCLQENESRKKPYTKQFRLPITTKTQC